MAQTFSPEEYMGRALDSNESVEVPGALFTHLCDDEMQSMIVAVGGACRRENGRRHARAALGVFFGNNSRWNKSELLPRRSAYPSSAELCAVLRTLRLLQTDIAREWRSFTTEKKSKQGHHQNRL